MMKINLLGHEAAVAARPTSAISPANRQAASFLVPLVAGMAIVLFIHYLWSSEVQRAKKQLAAALAEQRALAAVQAQNQMYQRELATLKQRVNTIQELQTARTGPVRLMASLGATVDRTSNLYLVTVNPNGKTLQIQGISDSVQSIAQFISSLNHSGVFTNVLLSRYFEDDRGNRPSYKFDLRCEYQPPPSPATAAGNAPATPTPRPAK